ncbi:UDP-N-acetylglucosamine 2-epimerase (non-hydrolyzing), partial [Methanospirillum sp.]|uniref:non-hydrolyzing UDP-N-acetylglucosamine 2-epimerase n=1 Tax=Methanospirillum sp. TaxID=45200 RepID=UPI002D1FC0E8
TMKILSIVGARPQFIKCAPVSRELRKEHREVLVHTGQHYDPEMSDVFFEELAIPKPEYHLGVGSGPHGKQTGECLAKIEEVLIKEHPDLVLVYGDTNSTLAGGLAAAKLHIPVAHVEAGLRSFDRTMPEEINRILVDHISEMLFCPTQTAVDNLRAEGITKGVFLIGDVMVDALEYNREVARKRSDILQRYSLIPGKYLVLTIHRPSNTDNPEHMENIIGAIGDCGVPTLFPVHPRTKKYLISYGLWDRMPDTIITCDPLGYLDMLAAMDSAGKILTDSGGVQKEAYLLSVPCITLRENTEWVETVEVGWNVLVGADRERIVRMIGGFIPPVEHPDLFGRDASGRILESITDNFI